MFWAEVLKVVMGTQNLSFEIPAIKDIYGHNIRISSYHHKPQTILSI